MRRTSTRLSDGRELIYFDHDEAPARTSCDERDLGPGSTEQGVMRRDPLTGEWVSIAGHRQTRIFLPAASACPLCPSNAENLSEIPESSYDVAVFENRFPSFTLGEAAEVHGDELKREMPAHGRCEVVAFSADHDGSLGALSADDMSLVVAAWMDRTRELAEFPGIRYVFVFENRGAEVGVTLHHPHGQIYAYPFVPPSAASMLAEAAAYHSRMGANLFRDVLNAELTNAARVVFADELWAAYVPFAARWPYELHLAPINERSSLAELNDEEVRSFAALLPRLVRGLDTLFDAPFPYMAGWLQRPAHATAEEARDARLLLRMISNRRSADKLKYLAGSESLMGAFINDVSPEEAAAQLRSVIG